MKLLRLQVSGLSLFKDDLDIMFYGTQNISIEDKETMYPLFSNIYLNCATVFIGKNASGKTTILETLSEFLNLGSAEPFEYIQYVIDDATYTITFEQKNNAHLGFHVRTNEKNGIVKKIGSNRSNNRNTGTGIYIGSQKAEKIINNNNQGGMTIYL